MPGVQEPRNAGLLDFPEAGIRGGSLTLQNGSPFQTEPGHAGSRSDFSKAAVQLGVSTIRNEVLISLTSIPLTGRLQTNSIAFLLRPLADIRLTTATQRHCRQVKSVIQEHS